MPTTTDIPTEVLEDEMVAALKQRLEQGQARETELRQEIQEKTAELREKANNQKAINLRYERAIKALAPPPREKKRKPASASPLDPNKIDLLMAYFHKHSDREVLSVELREHSEFGTWGNARLFQHINALRDESRIRLVGQRQSPNGKNKVKAYAIDQG